MRDGKEYYEISGVINEECKRALTEADFLNYIHTANLEWRYRLYKGKYGCNHFCVSKNYVGFLLNSVELKEFEESCVELSNKRLSSISVCGKNRGELFVCLSDSEICEMAEEYQIDVQKCRLIKEQSVYHVTTDYFDLSVFDLW